MTSLKSGNTPLIKIDEFSEYFGLAHLLVKDESKNPTGTWKDRRSEEIVRMARKESVRKLCLITSGNAGFSLAKFAEPLGIETVSIVDINLSPTIKEALSEAAHGITESDLSKHILSSDEVVSLAQDKPDEIIWDVTNGFHEAYKTIIEELAEQNAPDYIICPVGSGEGFVGLARGLEEVGWSTKLIGVTATENPSIADKLHTSWTPYSAIMRSIIENGHQIILLQEEEIKSAFLYAKNHINCEPSSAVVIAAIPRLSFNKNDKIIVINSGRGLF